MKTFLCTATLLGFAVNASSQQTAFYFTSSPQSFVGQGDSALVTPTNGFSFSVSQGGSAVVTIEGQGSDTRWWQLQLAMPNLGPLQPGTYLGATRYPFESFGTPGLYFIGNARSPDELTGSFTVLDISYAAPGVVDSLAADFVQYEEGNPAMWDQGSIRYNSLIPIPEPGPIALLAFGLSSAGLLAKPNRARNPRLAAQSGI